MKIPIKTNNILLSYFESINYLFKLHPSEMKVVECLVRRYYEYIEEGIATYPEIVFRLIFDKDEKKKMRESLNITEPFFNVSIARLKAKKVLFKDSKGQMKIHPLYLFNEKKEQELTIIYVSI